MEHPPKPCAGPAGPAVFRRGSGLLSATPWPPVVCPDTHGGFTVRAGRPGRTAGCASSFATSLCSGLKRAPWHHGLLCPRFPARLPARSPWGFPDAPHPRQQSRESGAPTPCPPRSLLLPSVISSGCCFRLSQQKCPSGCMLAQPWLCGAHAFLHFEKHVLPAVGSHPTPPIVEQLAAEEEGRAYCPPRGLAGQGTAPPARHHPSGRWVSPAILRAKLTGDWVPQVRSRHSDSKDSNRAPSHHPLSWCPALCPPSCIAPGSG